MPSRKKLQTAIIKSSGCLVEIKMAVNSICWRMPSKFRFYSAKSKRRVRVRPYLVEFKKEIMTKNVLQRVCECVLRMMCIMYD